MPIIVVNESMMSFSRKLSIVALLSLSTVMIVCSLIRIVGSLTETTETGNGTAPVWAAFWFIVESCVALIMASVIVIRGVFISNIDDDRRKQDSIFQQFGRRLLSILKLSKSSSNRRWSPKRSDPLHDQQKDGNAPRIATQKPLRGTLQTVRAFISGGKRHSQTQEDTQLSEDTYSGLEEMDYHNIRKAEVAHRRP